MFSSIKNWITKAFIGDYLGGIVRLLLGIVAGWMVKSGIADQEAANAWISNNTEIAIAGATALVAWLLSLANKTVEVQPGIGLVKK